MLATLVFLNNLNVSVRCEKSKNDYLTIQISGNEAFVRTLISMIILPFIDREKSVIKS